MKIALDYDLTYSADPVLWREFISLAKAAGHDIRIVTARDVRLDRTGGIVFAEQFVEVIYCGGVAKKWFCERFVEDFSPDVWIDDKPESILVNSSAPPPGLVAWRATRDEGPVFAR